MRSERRKLYTKYRLEVAKEAGRGDRCRLRTDRMKRGAGLVHAVPKARLSAAALRFFRSPVASTPAPHNWKPWVTPS